MLDAAMSAAWEQASKQFGIEVVAPYVLQLADGTTVEVEAFLPKFGGPHGAIAVAVGTMIAAAARLAPRSSCHVSLPPTALSIETCFETR